MAVVIPAETVLPPVRPAHPAGADLAQLLAGAPSVHVTGVSISSRAVVAGDLYVGLAGASTHGARYAADAVARGAVAVVTDAAGAALTGDLDVPVVVVDDPRLGAGEWAADVYGRPADKVQAFGITGTNGKTTTLYLITAALAAAGRTVATIGTIGAQVAGETIPMSRTTVTTPESPDLQALLAVMVERGADTVVMEVSSHALAMHRVDAVPFDVAAFTNLGWDHRDFHPTQEDYFEAKARLFLPGQARGPWSPSATPGGTVWPRASGRPGSRCSRPGPTPTYPRPASTPLRTAVSSSRSTSRGRRMRCCWACRATTTYGTS